MTIKVTVWNEYLHEIQFKEIAAIYPKGIHGCIAEFLEKAGMEQIPVISMSAGIEKNPGLDINYKMADRALQALIYGDVFMRVLYKTRPYIAVY